MNFSLILNNEDRKNKSKSLFRRMVQDGKDFNNFVLASIEFFYKDGAKQINIINDLLKMAQRSKGMNAVRLASYLKVVIPHDLVEGDNAKNIPPKFAKKDGAYLDYDQVVNFIWSHPEWHKYGKNSTTKSFDLNNLFEMVAKRCETNGIPFEKFNQEYTSFMANRLVANIGK